jgi:putative Mg2+ transporter-C (MgtC) family protein
MIVSISLATHHWHPIDTYNVNVDPGRIAYGVMTGIGFIGAGTIMQARGTVMGLTSAATIWVVAAIGSAVGSGEYLEAVGTTVMVTLVLVGLKPVERRILATRRTVNATLRVQRGTTFEEIHEVIRSSGVHVLSRTTYEHQDDRAFELKLVGAAKQFDALVDTLQRRSDVISVQVD